VASLAGRGGVICYQNSSCIRNIYEGYSLK
jgi:hypothetical protein